MTYNNIHIFQGDFRFIEIIYTIYTIIYNDTVNLYTNMYTIYIKRKMGKGEGGRVGKEK